MYPDCDARKDREREEIKSCECHSGKPTTLATSTTKAPSVSQTEPFFPIIPTLPPAEAFCMRLCAKAPVACQRGGRDLVRIQNRSDQAELTGAGRRMP